MLDISNYKDMQGLISRSTEVFMRPEYGNYNLYKANAGGMFNRKNQVIAELHAAVPVLHGTNCEDGIFEGLLETIGLPFAGCNTLSSANGMDKITMKMILRESGILVVDYVWFTDKEWFRRREGIIDEVEKNGEHFGRAKLYSVMMRYVVPVVMLILFLTSTGFWNLLFRH